MCIIELTERLPCPGLRLRVFYNIKNTNFWLKGVDYGLSPYFSSVCGGETMPYIIN
jgi:hypothetical protein